ncbi:MAG: hypothetical protein P8R54_28415 [Myxococcota bacterium]|nr:hypothetical protein [Myxococcota bacterium]
MAAAPLTSMLSSVTVQVGSTGLTRRQLSILDQHSTAIGGLQCSVLGGHMPLALCPVWRSSLDEAVAL